MNASNSDAIAGVKIRRDPDFDDSISRESSMLFVVVVAPTVGIDTFVGATLVFGMFASVC